MRESTLVRAWMFMLRQRAKLTLEKGNGVGEGLGCTSGEDLCALARLQLDRPQSGPSVVHDRHAARVGRAVEPAVGVKHFQMADGVRK
jgi:hypothetical protein